MILFQDLRNIKCSRLKVKVELVKILQSFGSVAYME